MNDFNIIIACHGKMATEIKNSAQMILGEQKNLSSVEFLEGNSLEDLQKNILEKFDSNKKNIILTDIKGGSPFNVSFKIKYDSPNTVLFTGVNLPLVIEIINELNILNRDELNITNEKLHELISQI